MSSYSYWFETLFLHYTFTSKRQKKLPSPYLLIIIQPIKRYQWKFFPQGILNSHTMCLYFIQQSLEMLHKKFPQSIVYDYMDDMLLALSLCSQFWQPILSILTFQVDLYMFCLQFTLLLSFSMIINNRLNIFCL